MLYKDRQPRTTHYTVVYCSSLPDQLNCMLAHLKNLDKLPFVCCQFQNSFKVLLMSNCTRIIQIDWMSYSTDYDKLISIIQAYFLSRALHWLQSKPNIIIFQPLPSFQRSILTHCCDLPCAYLEFSLKLHDQLLLSGVAPKGTSNRR